MLRADGFGSIHVARSLPQGPGEDQRRGVGGTEGQGETGALDLVDPAADSGAGDFGVCRFLRHRGQGGGRGLLGAPGAGRPLPRVCSGVHGHLCGGRVGSVNAHGERNRYPKTTQFPGADPLGRIEVRPALPHSGHGDHRGSEVVPRPAVVALGDSTWLRRRSALTPQEKDHDEDGQDDRRQLAAGRPAVSMPSSGIQSNSSSFMGCSG